MTTEASFLNHDYILIVDDAPVNVEVLARMLEKAGYRTQSASSGKLALQAAQRQPPGLILLDISMPEMTGYEVCERLKADKRLREIPVIFISALAETLDKVKAFAVGGVDYITKPFQFEEVRVRVQSHLQLHRLQLELELHNHHLQELVEAQVREISDSQMATIFALAKLAESRDDNTGRHLERVQAFCRLLATKVSEHPAGRAPLTLPDIENLYCASPLHDIGKVGILDSILLKPGRLTPEEYEAMKGHTLIGAQTLEAVQGRYPRNAFVTMGITIARSHHERWDGGGYPDGLAGENIPLPARIMAVVDVYDALRSRRCYKLPFPHEQSRDIILQGHGTQFDPLVVEVFQATQADFGTIWDKMQE